MLSESRLEPDPELVAEGWERRFIADGRRAEEMTALYRELGYEVLTVPVKAEEFGDECDDCQLLGILKFTTIYTRQPTVRARDRQNDHTRTERGGE